MKMIAAAILLLACQCANMHAQESVTFTKQPFPVGLSISSMENFMAHIMVQSPGAAEPILQKHLSTQKQLRYTVLETAEGSVSRMRVQFDNIVDAPARTGVEQVRSPLIGKTYVLSFGSENFSASTEDGSDVAPDILKTLRREVGNDILLERFSALLAGMTLTKGVETDIPLDVAEGFNPSLQSIMKLKKAKMTLAGLHNENGEHTAIIEFVFSVEGAMPDLAINADLKGFVAIGADNCWPMSVSLQGEFGGELNKQEKMVVVGMVSGERNAIYTTEK